MKRNPRAERTLDYFPYISILLPTPKLLDREISSFPHISSSKVYKLYIRKGFIYNLILSGYKKELHLLVLNILSPRKTQKGITE